MPLCDDELSDLAHVDTGDLRLDDTQHRSWADWRPDHHARRHIAGFREDALGGHSDLTLAAETRGVALVPAPHARDTGVRHASRPAHLSALVVHWHHALRTTRLGRGQVVKRTVEFDAVLDEQWTRRAVQERAGVFERVAQLALVRVQETRQVPVSPFRPVRLWRCVAQGFADLAGWLVALEVLQDRRQTFVAAVGFAGDADVCHEVAQARLGLGQDVGLDDVVVFAILLDREQCAEKRTQLGAKEVVV